MSTKRPRTEDTQRATDAAPQNAVRSAHVRFALGAVLLMIALGSACVLALDHMGAMRAPGCGPRGACDQAAATAFGRVPILGWPLAYVGCAWFFGLLVAWTLARGSVAGALRWMVRSSAVFSLFFVGMLVVLGLPCPYCIAVHASNLAFVLLVELTPGPRTSGDRRPLAITTLAALACGLVLFGLHTRTADARRARAERELATSTEHLIHPETNAQDSVALHEFVGRHRRGPASALARIVIFTDYQCADCRRMEDQLEALLASAGDVSLSIKHFPLCASCNAYAPDMHPNACWAARAAEAAASTAGEDGFWRMHRWLFSRGGAFTASELDIAITELGFDRTQFLTAMHAPATLDEVKSDIEEGQKLGLTQTPLIYVNGVELRGWDANDAIERAVAGLRARGIAPANADHDRPPSARERFLSAWREAPVESLHVDDAPQHVLGPPDAKVQVIMFGDYLEPFTCEADASLRAIVSARGDVRYVFKNYPVCTACNPSAESNMHPLACVAALGAEVAGFLGGNDGFWTMHAWIVSHSATFDEAKLTDAAVAIGMDRAAFQKALASTELEARIESDLSAAKFLGLTYLPLILVNGRRVAQWKALDENLLPVIVAEAAGTSAAHK